jgi:hypothetical protein
MSVLTLTRHAATPWGTFGKLTAPGFLPISTLEKPWRNNEPYVSCIPVGQYPLQEPTSAESARRAARNLFQTINLTNVPDREGILIHVGNWQHETHGCIVVGEGIATINGNPGVTRSQSAMKRLWAHFQSQAPSHILIQWATVQPVADPY